MSKRSSEAGADEPATEVFTALAILNREGHAPAAADRSAQPQHRQGVDPGDEPDKRAAVRRGAIAGGAVLAGGAALGVAILADSEPTADETAPAGSDGGEDAYPGQGLLDPEVSAEAPPEPVVIDPAASTGSLDGAAPVVSHGALAGVPTGTGPAQPEAGGAGAASASPDPSGHDAAPGGSGGGDDTAFGSGSGGETSGGDASGGDTEGGDEGGDEGGLLGVGSDEGVLDTGLLASDSESSGDGSESFGDSGGEDDGGDGLLGTGLLG